MQMQDSIANCKSAPDLQQAIRDHESNFLYICYRGQQDRDRYVKQLYYNLQKLGVPSFYDDECVGWGQPTQDVCQQALMHSNAAVVVVSQSLVIAQHLPIDLNALLEKEKRRSMNIYPLLVDDVNEDFYMERMPFVHSFKSLRVPSGPDGIQTAAQQIKKLYSNSVQHKQVFNSGIHISCKGNLPELPPHFRGRNALVGSIASRLTTGPGRIVSLEGMPGVGKSVVAVAVATELSRQGWKTIYADVRELTLQDSVAGKIIEVLGDTENRRSGITGFVNAVRNLGACQDGTLLVLDNCDGLLDPMMEDEPKRKRPVRRISPLCGLLDTIFQHNQHLKVVITTSRKLLFPRLTVNTEKVVPLSVEDAADYLREKCQKQVSHDQTDWPMTLAIMCGGFPVALNILSAILQNNILSTVWLIHHLRKKGFSRCGDLLANHFSLAERLEDCFSEAFNHLQTEKLKDYAAAITVFPQLFKLDAAAAVLNLEPAAVRHTVIQPLLCMYLLQEMDGHQRYYMPSVVRDHIRELGKVQHKGVISEAIQRFMKFYTYQLQQTGKTFWEDPVKAQDALDTDWQNFELALSGRCPSSTPVNFVPTVMGALPLLKTRLPLVKLIGLCESYLPMNCGKPAKARLLLETADMHIQLRNVNQALVSLSEARDLLRPATGLDVDSEQLQIVTACYHRVRGRVHLALNKPVDALAFYTKSWKIYRRVGSRSHDCIATLMDLGRSYTDLRLFDEAIKRYKEARMRLGPKGKYHPYTVDLLMQIGETESTRLNQDEALKFMFDALTKASDLQLGDLSRAPILYEIGVTLLLKRETTEGMSYLDKALEVSKRVNGCQLLHFFIATLTGKLKYNEGLFQEAAESLQDAVNAAREARYEGDAYVESLAYLSVAYKSQAMHDKASATYESFLQSLERCDSKYVHANSTVQLLRLPICKLKFDMGSTSSPEFVQKPPKATFCCSRYSSFRRWHRNCGEIPQVGFLSSSPKTEKGMQLPLLCSPRSPSLFLTMQPLSNDAPSYCYLDGATSVGRARRNSEVIRRSIYTTLGDHTAQLDDYRSHQSSPISMFSRLVQWSVSSPAEDAQTNRETISIRRCQSLPSMYHHSDDDCTSYERLNSSDSGERNFSSRSDSTSSRKRIDSFTSNCEASPSGSLKSQSVHVRRLSKSGQSKMDVFRQVLAISEPAPSHETDTVDTDTPKSEPDSS